MVHLLVWLTILWSFLASSTWAQDRLQINEVNLNHSARINMLPDEVFLIQLEDLSHLSSIEKYRYLGGDWAAMKWKDMEEQDVFSKMKIARYGKLLPTSKMSTNFSIDYQIEKSYLVNEKIEVYVHSFFQGDELLELLRSYQIEVLSSDKSKLFHTVLANKNQLDKLVQENVVSFVEPVMQSRTPLLSAARGISNLENVHLELPDGLGIQGEGIKIGVWDYGIAGFHRDLKDKVVNVEKDFFGGTASQHATFVSGAIASNGVLRPLSIGAAPKSTVYTYNFFSDVLQEVIDAKNKYNVSVTNHSYNLGSGFRCFVDYEYSTASAQIDQLAIDEPRMTHVFAAGNSAIACAWDYQTIAPGFQYGKNIIVVGNIQDDEDIYPGSAQGPTNDGRLRPDVVAKGAGNFNPNYGIVLPSPTDSYAGGWGTSFASPIVAGVVGLMQEAYHNEHGQMPLSTTVKAILCNTATDIGAKGPDFKTGYGKINAYEAIKAIQNSHFIESSLTVSETNQHIVSVGDGVEELKVFLTWNDLPTSLPYERVLTNDLDLIVRAPDGSVFYPLVLDSKNPANIAQQGRDSLNNSEQVVILNPIAGDYIIEVNAYSLHSNSQAYSISYWTQDEKFSWHYPISNSILSASETNHLRWTTTDDSDSIIIQYSTNQGLDWMHVGNQSSSQKFFSWTTPAEHFPEVQLRALTSNGDVLGVSDVFAISPLAKIKSTTICYDHIILNWDGVDTLTTYQILLLDENNDWNQIGETQHNQFIWTPTQVGKEYYFAIQPVIEDFIGLRSHAVKVIAINNRRCDFLESDIGISSVLPKVGAKHTEYALTDEEPLTIQLINYSKTVLNNIQLYYQVDTGQIFEYPISRMTANQVLNITTPEVFDFSEVGSYEVKVWIEAVEDMNASNDTLIQKVEQKESYVASFPYYQDFENLSDTSLYTQKNVGIEEMPEWDYVPEGAARLYSFSSNDFSPQGEKAWTLDAHTANVNSVNNLYLHIDLESAQDKLVYLDFKILNRGDKIDGDTVFIKGNVLDKEWIPVYNIFENNVGAGVFQEVKGINLSKAIHEAGQSMTNHTVIKFKTTSNNRANTISASGGYTLDDVRIYDAGIDLSIDAVDLAPVYCMDEASELSLPVKVLVTNHAPQVIAAGEVVLELMVDDSVVFSEIISQELPAFETIEISLDQELILTGNESYAIQVNMHYNEDSLLDNNIFYIPNLVTIPTVQELPLELNFDDNDIISLVPSGNAYSWELGIPQKRYLNDVADNTGQVWATNLQGLYPPNEYSHLYIGCIEPEQLNYSSEIALLKKHNLEYASDALWLEFSTNGKTWEVLGDRETGYNWYNQEHTYNVWDTDQLTWQASSHNLNQLNQLNEAIMLRFAFSSNEYIELEGVALDRIRILDYSNARIPNTNVAATGVSSGNGWIDLLDSDERVIAYVDDKGQQLGHISLKVTIHPDEMPTYRNQFLAQRYFYLETKNEVAEPFELKLYLSNREYLNYLQADKHSSKMGDLGYLLYTGVNADTSFTNNHFKDNYSFHAPEEIDFWPYMNGYEMRLKIQQKVTEIYITSHQANEKAYPDFISILDFEADYIPNSNFNQIRWRVKTDNSVQQFEVQHATDVNNFEKIALVDAQTDQEEYTLIDSVNVQSGEHFYRIVARKDSLFYTSLLDSVLIPFTTHVFEKELANNTWKVSYVEKGHLNLYLSDVPKEKLHLRIVDVSGKIIQEWANQILSPTWKIYSESLTKAPSGMYFLQISNGKTSSNNKFIKSD